MCSDPEHAILHRIEAVLKEVKHDVEGLSEDVVEVRENQASLMDEVFGKANKKGLSAKVDDITAGRKVETGVVSTITAVIVATLTALGFNVGGGN